MKTNYRASAKRTHTSHTFEHTHPSNQPACALNTLTHMYVSFLLVGLYVCTPNQTIVHCALMMIGLDVLCTCIQFTAIINHLVKTHTQSHCSRGNTLCKMLFFLQKCDCLEQTLMRLFACTFYSTVWSPYIEEKTPNCVLHTCCVCVCVCGCRLRLHTLVNSLYLRVCCASVDAWKACILCACTYYACQVRKA